MLFYTALKRDANEVLQAQNEKTVKNINFLTEMKNLVPKLREVISVGKGIAPAKWIEYNRIN